MAVAALDYGRRRIGVAVTDADERWAYPLGIVLRRSLDRDIGEIDRLISTREVRRLVVGMPFNMDGTEGSAAREVRRFARKIGAGLKIPVDFFDERLTSFEAEQRLQTAGISRRKKKAAVDAVAAQLILEGWLSAHREDRDGGKPK